NANFLAYGLCSSGSDWVTIKDTRIQHKLLQPDSLSWYVLLSIEEGCDPVNKIYYFDLSKLPNGLEAYAVNGNQLIVSYLGDVKYVLQQIFEAVENMERNGIKQGPLQKSKNCFDDFISAAITNPESYALKVEVMVDFLLPLALIRCEAFSTYPRTYDLLHAWTVLSDVAKKDCSPEDLLIEMDRIVRPTGFVIFRDKQPMIDFVKKYLTALQ
ncbi:hypothetical protein TSUD_30740, partial [Trifolium subterraneum]